MSRVLLAATVITLALTACTTTNTVPIAPDTFRLDSTASGYAFTGSAGADTLLKAAEITQQRGYSYFVILNSDSAAGTAYAGSTVNRFGGALFSTPSYTPTQTVSVVVKMLQVPAEGAWSVTDVIAKKGEMF